MSKTWDQLEERERIMCNDKEDGLFWSVIYRQLENFRRLLKEGHNPNWRMKHNDLILLDYTEDMPEFKALLLESGAIPRKKPRRYNNKADEAAYFDR